MNDPKTTAFALFLQRNATKAIASYLFLQRNATKATYLPIFLQRNVTKATASLLFLQRNEAKAVGSHDSFDGMPQKLFFGIKRKITMECTPLYMHIFFYCSCGSYSFFYNFAAEIRKQGIIKK